MKIQRPLLIPIIVITTAVIAKGGNYYQYLVNAQSLVGATGNIVNPSPYTTPEKNFTFGLHRFVIGFNYGINSLWETGINLNLREFSAQEKDLDNLGQEEKQGIIIHMKYRIIGNHSNKKLTDLALGVYSDTLYLVAGRQLSSISKTICQLGTDFAYSGNRLCYFVTFIQPTKYSFFICEYKSRTSESNFGWRVLLSPHVKLDVFIRSTGNLKDWFSTFIFGLTLATKRNVT